MKNDNLTNKPKCVLKLKTDGESGWIKNRYLLLAAASIKNEKRAAQFGFSGCHAWQFVSRTITAKLISWSGKYYPASAHLSGRVCRRRLKSCYPTSSHTSTSGSTPQQPRTLLWLELPLWSGGVSHKAISEWRVCVCLCVQRVYLREVSVWRDLRVRRHPRRYRGLARRQAGRVGLLCIRWRTPSPISSALPCPRRQIGGTGPGSGRDGGLERSLVSTVRLMNGQEEKV